MKITEEEIIRIKLWCKNTKKEEGGRTYLIKQYPFSLEIPFARNILFIEIDKPVFFCGKQSLVYDSSSDKLFRFVDARWIETLPSKY